MADPLELASKLNELGSIKEKETLERITSIEYTQQLIQDDIKTIQHNQNMNRLITEQYYQSVEELLDWVRNARRGARMARSFTGWITRLLVLLSKIGAALAVLWALGIAIKTGKLPEIHLP